MKYLQMGGLLLAMTLAGATWASAQVLVSGTGRCNKTCSGNYNSCIRSCVKQGSQPTCTVPCAQVRKGCLATGEWQSTARFCTGVRKR